MPYADRTSARTSRNFPAVSTSASGRRRFGLELRGTLGDQRVLLANPPVALLGDGDDDLAALAERVRDRAAVGDRHGLVALAVAHAEDVDRAALDPRPLGHLARQLVGLAGDGARQQLARTARLGRRGEARVDEGAGQQDRGREGHDQPDGALATRVHAGSSIAGPGPEPARDPASWAPARSLSAVGPLT